jgi:hypothetical protein
MIPMLTRLMRATRSSGLAMARARGRTKARPVWDTIVIKVGIRHQSVK